jgi:hypothetical protein
LAVTQEIFTHEDGRAQRDALAKVPLLAKIVNGAALALSLQVRFSRDVSADDRDSPLITV